MINKSKLVSALQKKIVTVHFTKKDKTPRTMHCTQNIDCIPLNKRADTDNSSDQIRVYDVEKNDWRSFDINSVTVVVY